jgi:transcriptional regulator with XRE-family HTH domain
MNLHEDVSVGNQIRLLRSRKGFSMRALAEKSGLSTNAISKIERGETSPTVSSLRRIATALEIPVIALFKDETDEVVIFIRRDERPQTKAEGAIIETLGVSLPEQSLEPFLITLDPQAGNTSDNYSHSGEEFVYCLAGEVEYRVGDRIFSMEVGDSLLFDPSMPHSFRNPSQDTSQILIIIQEQDPESLQLAQKAHKKV